MSIYEDICLAELKDMKATQMTHKFIFPSADLEFWILRCRLSDGSNNCPRQSFRGPYDATDVLGSSKLN
jgi:hypothetical protein